MNRIATEFAIEIVVHLKERDTHTSPRQQEREHRPGGSASGDAATRRFILHYLSLGGSIDGNDSSFRDTFRIARRSGFDIRGREK